MSKKPDLAKILTELPRPLAVYASPKTTFEVYRAKDMHSHRWNHASLKTLVALCRMSYSRYGNRPPFDEHDGKATIYLVRSIDQIPRGGRTEEWLSLRIVPGDRKPIGVFEPELYEQGGKRIDQLMRRKIGRERFWNRVASSSRMCGIHPYALSKTGSVRFLSDAHHGHTPVSFALMHKQFLIDYPLSRFPYRYITGMIRADFYKKGLSYISRNRATRPLLMPAHQFLGLKNKKLSVRRDAYSYAFPLYWFNVKKLLALVNGLRKKEHKPALTTLTPDMFSHLPEQTRRPVEIAGVRIEPARMRQLIDKSVPDAPELKITEAKPWYRSMEAVLRAAKVESVAK